MKYEVMTMAEAQAVNLPHSDYVHGERAHEVRGIWAIEDDVAMFLGSDGGEPEDNSFRRDWSWVAPALAQAFELGRKTGHIECANDLGHYDWANDAQARLTEELKGLVRS